MKSTSLTQKKDNRYAVVVNGKLAAQDLYGHQALELVIRFQGQGDNAKMVLMTEGER